MQYNVISCLSNVRNYFPNLYFSSIFSLKTFPFSKLNNANAGISYHTGRIFCDVLDKSTSVKLRNFASKMSKNVVIYPKTWSSSVNVDTGFLYNYVDSDYFFKQLGLCYVLYYIFNGFITGRFSYFFSYFGKLEKLRVPCGVFLKKKEEEKRKKEEEEALLAAEKKME